MRKDLKEKMEYLGFKEVKECNDFLFGLNENNLLIRIMYIDRSYNAINVNHLEHIDGHSYSYFIDKINTEEECNLERYFKLNKEDLSFKSRLKLS
ncbi:MAG: hypothetical protein CL760_01555 [Chloroflexi bacterium]|nr:hypothetical protein [Chloroflexota bacterium]|tara:strand:- start:63798 stop:64082 length:285 start_codon:yes stop_codon:yes gene_type:complete